jgi:hypothetical protein
MSPSPLQAVLLFQHHQTTTPYAPGPTPTALAEPTQAQTTNEEKNDDAEKH